MWKGGRVWGHLVDVGWKMAMKGPGEAVKWLKRRNRETETLTAWDFPQTQITPTSVCWQWTWEQDAFSDCICDLTDGCAWQARHVLLFLSKVCPSHICRFAFRTNLGNLNIASLCRTLLLLYCSQMNQIHKPFFRAIIIIIRYSALVSRNIYAPKSHNSFHSLKFNLMNSFFPAVSLLSVSLLSVR